MSRFLRLSLLVTAILLIIACGLSASPSSTTNTFAGETSPLNLTVQPQTTTYSTLNQSIVYNFVITYNGTTSLAGPVTVTDDKMTVQCPGLNTVGNHDDKLDPAPVDSGITCTGTYSITSNDLTLGSVTDVATAKVGTVTSNTASAVIRVAENKVLTIAVSAEPTTYSAAGQQIKYFYTITNASTQTLGPAQFIVRDDHIPNPINCQTDQTILAPNQNVKCDAIYTTTPTDTTVSQIVNSVTASAPSIGVGTIQAGSVVVSNANIVGGSNSGAFTKGSTIQHDVKDGEWMMQIARCYGANIDATIKANPQVTDPNVIFPADHLTVPNIGSFTGIHGPPCVTLYTVKSGDTWASIANDPNNNAAVDVLMEANQDVSLTAGRVLRIPVNSKAYAGLSTVVTPPPAKQPIRINFPTGSTTTKIEGDIGTPATVRYVLTGAVGQILTVKVSVPANDVGLAIYAPNGNALKPLDAINNSWSGPLPSNGDYFIDLVSSLGATSKHYSLEVTLTTPAPASPFGLVMDINNGAASSNVSYLAVFKNLLYFQADKGDGAGPELWQYDSGLNAITRKSDKPQGPVGLQPTFLTPLGDFLYFSAKGDDSGTELWRFNGTDTGRVTEINPAGDANPMYLTVFKGALYFSAKGDDKGVELWKFDPATAVPTRITDINGAGDSNPAYLAEFNGVLYFSATSDNGTGTELWKYNGTDPATIAADIVTGLPSSNPAFLTVFKSELYFSANGNDKGRELWKFDGTHAPTLAADINATSDSVPTYLTVFKDELYFSAKGDSAGFELWKFNGTNPPTLAADINLAGDSNPAYLCVFNNELYFQANDGKGLGVELWKFKGP
jgi:ELWxxDGT repeat protein